MYISLRLNSYSTNIIKKQIKQIPKYKSIIDDDLKVKIGLEIHARILTKTKIFSDSECFNITNTPANCNVSFFDAALPGTMPTLNRRAVEASLLTALALKCKINSISYFDRKHYFYADLPAGFQITQQKNPIAFDGCLKYPVINPNTHRLIYKQCNIKRIQLEHDSARSLQIENLLFKLDNDKKLPKDSILVDLNRAGMGLMEIVTEPDFEEAFDCYSFTRELALVLRSIGTCDALMGEGGFRVDVNVSVHKIDKSKNPIEVLPGVRVELKNLSSFNAVLKATEYEIKRQKDLVKKNVPIQLETRTYDSTSGKTVSIRSKEDQYDYRFMPEPNLLPLLVYPSKSFNLIKKDNKFLCLNNDELIINQNFLDQLESFKNKQQFYVDLDKAKEELKTKNLPQTRRNFLIENFKLSNENAFVFIANNLDYILIEIAKSNMIDTEKDLKIIVKVLLTEYLNQVNENSDLEKIGFEVKCKKIASYIVLLKNELISRRIAIPFFRKLFELKNLDKLADDLVKEENLFIINDINKIKNVIMKLFNENQKAINEYKAKEKKRDKIFDFFVGRVHKELNDLADPKLVDELVLKSLKDLLN